MTTPANVSNNTMSPQYARIVSTNATSSNMGKTITTANTAKDGTGTVVPVYTNTSGSDSNFLGVYVSYTGTTVQTVLRLFINNGLTNATATNNAFLKSITVAPNTLSETTAANDFFVPINITIPPGYIINATIGTTVATALALTAIGVDLGV